MAGHFAGKIKAKKLVLTHFSQRYKGVSDSVATTTVTNDSDSVQKLLKQAKEAFSPGSVVAAEDFMIMQIPQKRE